ncbi:MAG: substrate-binding domain-containing protein [Pseudomonadota bacterium]
MNPWTVLKKAAVCAAFCVSSSLVAAQEVTLRFADGSFEVSGPLMGFDGLAYRIDTRFGVLTIAAATVICEGDCPTRADAPIIRISGAASMGEVLVPALVDAFARSLGVAARPVAAPWPGAVALAIQGAGGETLAVFEIASGTTAQGFQALSSERADIVMADRAASAAEREAALVAEIGDLAGPLRRRLVARRPLGLVAARDLGPVSANVEELIGLLTGEVESWAALGGVDRPPRVAVAQDDVSALAFRIASLARLSAVEPGNLNIEAVEGPEALAAFLQEVPGAVVLSPEPIFAGRAVPLSHGCVTGSAERAEGDAYPLMVDLWFYTAAPRLPDMARAFLSFATGTEAQRVVDRAGFIDKRPRPVPLDAQGERVSRALLAVEGRDGLERLQTLMAGLRGFERLALAFRFEPDGAKLTPTSASEAQGLAAILDSGRLDGRRLLFLGFTDGEGADEVNLRLAGTRAGEAIAAVEAAMATRVDRTVMEARGLGSLMPLACEVSPWGRHVNRRVEVWVGPALP